MHNKNRNHNTQFVHWLKLNDYTIENLINRPVIDVYAEYVQWTNTNSYWKVIALKTFRQEAINYFPSLYTRKGIYLRDDKFRRNG